MAAATIDLIMSATPNRARVWVVDDSPTDAERARRVLTKSHRVEVFHDGSAVLERLSSEPAPDVLVLDWVMPGISGVEVCRFLRSQEAGKQGLGILLLTAHRNTNQIVEGLSAGANDYLAKPYEDAELSARVGALVRARKFLRRAEDAEEALRRLLETSPDPLLVLDANNCPSFVNEQASLVFGETQASICERTLSDLLPNFPQGLLNPRQGDSAAPIPELSIGGRLFSASLRVLPPNDVARAIISLRDVTEKRQLEERRLDFYSIIAHDLRNPLNVLKLRLARMLTLAQSAAADRLTHEIGRMDGTLDGLVAMINDFLELASLEGASYRLKRKSVDLKALILDVMSEFRPLLESRNQRFEGPVLLGSEDKWVTGDRQRLYQVLSNLISNAIKFTPPEGEICATLEADKSCVRVTIADTGCGIPKQVLPKLFQRYQRAEQHRVAGTGLGLLIVREIVEAHHGTVGVESEPERGTRFWFQLPRA